MIPKRKLPQAEDHSEGTQKKKSRVSDGPSDTEHPYNPFADYDESFGSTTYEDEQLRWAVAESLQTTPALTRESTRSPDSDNNGDDDDSGCWVPPTHDSTNSLAKQEREPTPEDICHEDPELETSRVTSSIQGANHVSESLEGTSQQAPPQDLTAIGTSSLGPANRTTPDCVDQVHDLDGVWKEIFDDAEEDDDPELKAAILASLIENASHVSDSRVLQTQEREVELEEAILQSLIDAEENKENFPPEEPESKDKKTSKMTTNRGSRALTGLSIKPYTRSMTRASTKPYARSTTTGTSKVDSATRSQNVSHPRRPRVQPSPPSRNGSSSSASSADGERGGLPSGEKDPPQRSEKRGNPKGKGKAPEYQ
ncbi:hypothetical protein B0O80DRAFT_525932 [Mortierella sp. GBAus27b]|nr:hypothetical protein BGX31_007484 [Mortierella sp. GBA43]KAI8360574.1 hypothetical protein B0O80DRAFT_525932 [Mortierella sp. GBAus27b]